MVFQASTLVGPLLTAAVIAIGGLFLQVSGHEIRLVKVEDTQVTTVDIANDIHKRQDKILYKLCLIINEGNMTKCPEE